MIRYFDHLKKYVVKLRGGYLVWSPYLKIYIRGSANNAKTFSTKEQAKEALSNYRKYK